MNKNTLIIVGLVVVALLIGGFIWSMKQKEENAMMEKEKMQKEEMMKKENDSMMKPTDAMMKQDEKMMPAETGAMKDDKMMQDEKMMKDDKQTLNYIDYSAASLASAAQNGGKPVIFFKARWCPTCQAADKAFTSHLDQIPAGVTILKADYDTEKDLKAKYGITYQHTFVQVDANGKELAKWNGGDIDNLTTHLQ